MPDKLITTRREFLAAGLVAVPFLRAVGREAEEKACQATLRGAGGPFYREGAPWRERLCGADEPGEPLVVEGRVTAADTCRPLAGAVLDVFQANAAGLYDTQIAGVDPARYHLRGRLRADAAGRYRFETVVPGNYTDGIERARHIHFRVSAEGYRPLVTECYFAGEPRNRTDRLVREPLIIGLSDFAHEKEGKKYRRGVFDLVLARA